MKLVTASGNVQACDAAEQPRAHLAAICRDCMCPAVICIPGSSPMANFVPQGLHCTHSAALFRRVTTISGFHSPSRLVNT